MRALLRVIFDEVWKYAILLTVQIIAIAWMIRQSRQAAGVQVPKG